MLDFDTFAEYFRHNLGIRSRTSKGESNTVSSADKPKLIGDSSHLINQVAKNTEVLIQQAWPGDSPGKPHVSVSTAGLWNDVVNEGLINPTEREERIRAYCSERPAVRPVRDFDKRWRTWDLKYSPVCVHNIGLELEEYQKVVSQLMSIYHLNLDLATLLGFVDYLHDGYIHPWADGCGRTSVALVMHTAAVWSIQHDKVLLPRYVDRDDIYKGAFDDPQPLAASIALYRDILVEV